MQNIDANNLKALMVLLWVLTFSMALEANKKLDQVVEKQKYLEYIMPSMENPEGILNAMEMDIADLTLKVFLLEQRTRDIQPSTPPVFK